MREYLIIIKSSSTTGSYLFTILSSGITGSGMSQYKEYPDEDSFKHALKSGLTIHDHKAVADILKEIADRDIWATKISLSNDRAIKLGWIE